ncbi:MAG: STAS domain-containing protein [Betaproteobacteria bacterium]|jgi:phospholipid transport system transporter-binding protein|nr:STAS domain-containing protein [Betaproteobacteria bacterium]MDH5342561.1 STAS domain-containing protein [Betaproteobacteria bacterium]
MIECNEGRCTLKGAVTLENALTLREEGLRLFAAPEVTLDLAGVTEVDSAAVSLLFEWRRAALAANRTIRYVNLPDNLTSLATLYGVTELVGAE